MKPCRSTHLPFGTLIVTAVVVIGVPSKSTSYNDEQYRYILNTMDDDEDFSERVRELIDMGIGMEERGGDLE